MKCPNCGTDYPVFNSTCDTQSCQNYRGRYMIMQIIPPTPKHGDHAVYTIKNEEDYINGFASIIEKFSKIKITQSTQADLIREDLVNHLNRYGFDWMSKEDDCMSIEITGQQDIVHEPYSLSKEDKKVYSFPANPSFGDYMKAIRDFPLIEVDRGSSWFNSWMTVLKSSEVKYTIIESSDDGKDKVLFKIGY